MKTKWIIGLLGISILFNVILTVQFFSKTEERDPRQLAYGISSTIQLLYSEMESFNKEYKAYQNGEVEVELLIKRAHETAFDINNIGMILESYEIVSLEYFQSIYDLSHYLSEIEKNPDEYNADMIAKINGILKRNSNSTIFAIYKEHPNLLKGNIPDQLKKLLIELDECLER